LARILRDELTRTSDRQRLLRCARRWLYEHRMIVLRERDLRMMIIKAIRQYEAELARMRLPTFGTNAQRLPISAAMPWRMIHLVS
jgi:hypothetical protein